MIKALIVLDGDYRFEEPAATQDFTFVTLVDALTSAGIDVTRAHRDSDGDGDITGFDFATSVDLLAYDVLWLIGHHGRNAFPGSVASSGDHPLSAAELGAIASFMDAGGGVFATGDHDSIGADMCGHIPRVRVMRAWFGPGDGASPMPADFPRNFDVVGTGRADTVQKNPLGDYDLDDDGVDDGHVYFENQSDSVPQPIVPATSPAHPILRRDGHDIVVYPDHMHEGQTLGEADLLAHHYTHTLPAGVDPSFVEFPLAADGTREPPSVIATGQVIAQTQRFAAFGSVIDPVDAAPKTVNTLCVYDGRAVGVGRVVTGATFHHYIDINLAGDSDIDTTEETDLTGPDAVKGQGFNYPGAESTFADIKAVYVNITRWLARPRPKIEVILERSTFSQDEVSAGSTFDGAVLVTVDGLKPSQFPSGPIDDLSPPPADLGDWAPTFPSPASGIVIEPIGVDSDAPSLPDQIQRFTFTYRVRFVDESAFGFAGDFQNFPVEATLSSSATASPLTDAAVIQLLKVANPFMLDLDHPDAKTWLSSDVRVFPVVAGQSVHGVTLPAGATRAQAYTFIQSLMSSISVAQFESLGVAQSETALSPFPTATDGTKVYNFAIARVRLNGDSATANQVRVFFRIFTSQTTAALTYRHPDGGEPQEGYKRTSGAAPIALPGTNAAGNEWLSFPFFAQARVGTPASQTDGSNVQNISPADGNTFFGALIDNNLTDNDYLPTTPGPGSAEPLPTLLMGEHQCLVAQIEYAGAPIPDGARPSTSDKLSQRNLAISEVANPGLDASRMALHTFEIEATRGPITDELLPDELLLEWTSGVPDGTYTSIYIPTWNAHEVVELADRFYARHDIQAEDEHTVVVPGGGTRYVPIPRSVYRQCGVLIAEFPLGIRRGQRFDLAVRQITNRSLAVDIDGPEVEAISMKEAKKLLTKLDRKKAATHDTRADRGVFDLGDNTTLVTDLSVFDMAGDGALVVRHPDPQKVAAARRRARAWRETIGGFQLGVPVSTKKDMLAHHMRLLSVLRWRAEKMRRGSRWYAAFRRYVDLIAKKVQALGGNPHAVPTTPDGAVGDLPPGTGGDEPGPGGPGSPPVGDPGEGFFEPETDDWLSDTTGLPDPSHAKARMVSGKISGLLFDHFGDFEGFTLELYDGRHLRFFSREPTIHDHARTAWRQRDVVTVVTVSSSSRRVRRLLIRGYPTS